MPTYSFKCKNCNCQWDLMQRISDPYPTDCPQCKEKGIMEKIFTNAPGLEFKGSGWFKSGGY